jgi:type 1 glutamine amidotransferase
MKLTVLLTALLLTATSACAAATKIKVLIIDGQNNHQWATTTPLLRHILEASNLFTVDVTTTPPKPIAPRLIKDATPAQKTAYDEALQVFKLAEPARIAAAPALWAKWRPRFTDYAVVISNYNGESWPEEVRTAFVAYVKNGGGFVSYHAADNAFPEWPEYNDMIGLGGWGDRNEKSGPYLRLRDGAWAPLAAPGPGGGHGPQREFLVTTSTADHPITRGLPATWMHSKDELYHQLRGPAKNLTVLGSAVSDITHEAEPLLLALSYGQGRVFHTALGHYVEALDGLGFQVTFLRGTEWAATGRVTQSAPAANALTATPPAAVRPLKLN